MGENAQIYAHVRSFGACTADLQFRFFDVGSPWMDRSHRRVSGAVFSVAPLHQASGEPGRFLVIRTATGRLFIDPAQIATVEVEGDEETVRKERERRSTL